MDIKSFIKVVSKMPPNVSILVRGPHGVGKSEIFSQIAEKLELPMIDRRLSQMSEGDLVGLPELVDGVTRFCPPDWYARACREPVILLLDEVNRATQELMQGAFQIVLARELNGHKLHPETRVYAAINATAEYQVNELDPALLDRFWVADLDPSKEDWVTWASGPGEIDSIMIDFINNHPAHLRHTGQIEPGKVYPTPRSWARLDRCLKHASMEPGGFAGGTSPDGFYATSLGFVGTEAAISFRDYIINYEIQVSGEDVVDSYKKVKPKLKAMTNDKLNSVIVKVVDHCKNNDWNVDQAKNVADFAKMMPGEMMVSLWNGVMDCKNVPNITQVHKFLGQAVVEAVTAARDV